MIEYTVKTVDKLYGTIEYRTILSNLFFEIGETFLDEWGDENTVLRIDRNNKFA